MSEILMDELSPSATRIRKAEIPPVGCASCYGQYPQREHVDFGASYEGPILGPQEGVVGAKMTSIDDLVICDECLTAAAKLIGMGNVEEADEAIRQQIVVVQERNAEIERLTDYVATLEKAVGQRQSLDKANAPQRVSKPRRR